MIIGVSGTFASGKDTVAQYLATKGFEHFSTADEIRLEMAEQGIEPNRNNMQDYSTEVRRHKGNAYFTQKALAKVTGDAVFADMRNPDEITALREAGSFALIIVDAPIELRFERAKARGRVGDGETLEAFREKEEREIRGVKSQKLGEVMAMADYHLTNDGNLEQLHKKIDDLLAVIRKTRN